jgi:hypothetical protein
VFYSVLRAEWPDVKQELAAGPKVRTGAERPT